MPIGPLELAIMCLIPLVGLALLALFLFVFLKVVSAIRGSRELGSGGSSAPGEEAAGAEQPSGGGQIS